MAAIDTELLDTKEYKAFVKLVGETEAKELLKRSDEDLKALISAHTVAMERTTQQTKATDAYAKAVEIKKDFDRALRDQLKPLKIAVKLAVKTVNARKG